MPWCPNCRTEYEEGVEVCADCGAALVDELPEEKNLAAVAYIQEEELAHKLVDYLEYSKIEAEIEYSDEQQAFAVLVDEKQLEEAKTAFRAFYTIETRNSMADAIKFDAEVLESIPEEEMSDEEKEAVAKAVLAEQVYKPAEVYVTKEDEGKDMFSTAITFLGFAAALLIFLVLNVLDIITWFNNVPSLIMLAAMAIGCCLVGINAIKRSRRAEIASVEEKKLTESLNGWLDENISDADFAVLEGEEVSEEVLYLKRTDIIRAKFLKAFPELDENYADALIEDFYDRYFEEAEETAEESEEEAEDTENDAQ